MTKSDWLGVAVATFCVALSFVVTPEIRFGLALVLSAVAAYAVIRWRRHRTQEHRPTAATWQDIEQRWRELQERNLQHRGDGPLHAFENEASQAVRWYVGAGALAEDAKRLCRLGGRKLVASGIAASYPRLQREPDDLDRWLWFLVELGQAMRGELSSQGYGHDGTTYPHEIRFLTQASLAGCVECLKHDMAATP